MLKRFQNGVPSAFHNMWKKDLSFRQNDKLLRLIERLLRMDTTRKLHRFPKEVPWIPKTSTERI